MKARDILPHERSEDNMIMAHRRLLVTGPAHSVASEAEKISRKSEKLVLNDDRVIRQSNSILLTPDPDSQKSWRTKLGIVET